MRLARGAAELLLPLAKPENARTLGSSAPQRESARKVRAHNALLRSERNVQGSPHQELDSRMWTHIGVDARLPSPQKGIGDLDLPVGRYFDFVRRKDSRSCEVFEKIILNFDII
jgi:hypothetical protein